MDLSPPFALRVLTLFAAAVALAAAIALLTRPDPAMPEAGGHDEPSAAAPSSAPTLQPRRAARQATTEDNAEPVVIREATVNPPPPDEALLPEEIAVEVRDARDGELLDGVGIEVSWFRGPETEIARRTGAGTFAIPRALLPEDLEVRIWAGNRGEHFRVQVRKWPAGTMLARRAPIVFRLEPSETLRYQAVDSEGLPLEGVHAATRWSHYNEQRSDANGFGWVDLPEDDEDRLLKLTARGYQFVRLDLREGPPDQVLRLVFPPPASLRLRLPPGTPPAGYRATLSLGEGIIHNQFQTSYPYADRTESAEGTRCRVTYRGSVGEKDREVLIETSFNERGEAVLAGFLDVDACSLELRFLEDRIAQREIRLPEQGGELAVDLPAAASARHRLLRVTNPDGHPLAAAKVTVAPVSRDPMGCLQTLGVDAPPPMEVRTDSRGRVRVPLGRDGRCPLVLVHAEGYGRRVFDHSDLVRADWVVRLEPGMDFRLEVTDCDGKAMSSGDGTPVYGIFIHHALVDLGHGLWVEGDERTIARDASGRPMPDVPDVWIFRDLPAATLKFTMERVEPELGVSLDTSSGTAMWAVPVSHEDIYLPGFK